MCVCVCDGCCGSGVVGGTRVCVCVCPLEPGLSACVAPARGGRRGGRRIKHFPCSAHMPFPLAMLCSFREKNPRLMLCVFALQRLAFFSLFFFFVISFFLSWSPSEAFLLPPRIFRVKGSLCALLLDLRFWKKKKSALERWNVR